MHSMSLPNLPPIPYVRTAKFKTLPDARITYGLIKQKCLVEHERFDIGIVALLYDEKHPLVVVTAFAEPPERKQQIIDAELSAGEAYDPDPQLIETIVMRRIRQLLSSESTALSDGFKEFTREGEYHLVDQYGRDK